MNWPWVLCLIRDCLPLNPDLNLITFITFKQSDENLEMCRVTPRKINSENLHAVQLGPCMGYFGLYFGIIEAFVPERKGLHLPKISSQSSQ